MTSGTAPHGAADDAATVQALSAAIALITSCHHLAPSERGQLAQSALGELRPELLVVALAQMALAYIGLCAQMVGVTPDAMLAEVGLTYARRAHSAP